MFNGLISVRVEVEGKEASMAPEQMSALVARLDELETKVAQLEGRGEPSGDGASPEQPVSRRRLIGLAGAVATGGVAGALIGHGSAGAADNGNLIIGVTNSNNNPGGSTILNGSTTTVGTSMLHASNVGVQRHGVQGTAAQGFGVFGEATSGRGVVGSASTGVGVEGESLGAGSGVQGLSSTGNSIWAGAPVANTTGAHLKLDPGATAGAPTNGAHTLGQLWMDNAGVLWQCVAPGTPGTWVRQSPLVTLASPVRIYYSLNAGDPPLANTGERSVTVTNGSTIPHSASAVLTNLAVTPSGADGFLAMFKHGTTWPGTSNLNYPAGQFASNNATSAVALDLGTGKVRIHCGGGAVHFVIDVFGYYP